MFGELPAWGLYARHVSGLTLTNVCMRIREDDYRPAVVLDDVAGFQQSALQVRGDTKTAIYHRK